MSEPMRPITRLAVNLAPDVADVLQHWAKVHDITITEAVRRAISVWNFVEENRNSIAVVDEDGVIRGVTIAHGPIPGHTS